MSFRDDNARYEKWLATQCKVVKADIAFKHHRMKKSAFIFLRATYFRWARKIGDWCPELMDAPPVLSVGDLHLENFGTWRDADGRLVWGVNDFDEAAVMPSVLDLVRLATSIQLAPDLELSNRRAAEALLRGYRAGLDEPAAGAVVRRRDLVAVLCRARRRQAREILEGDRRFQEIESAARDCQGVGGEPAQGRRQENCPPLPRSPQGRRQPGTAALPRGRLLARRAGAARGQGAGALGMELGPRSESNRGNRISSISPTAAIARRIRSCMCRQTSSSAASPPIPPRSNSAKMPAASCISTSLRRWDSMSPRSMPQARQASRR